jgi:hypothetical protein
MKTKLTVATAIVGSMLVTCLISGSAQATSVPVLKSDATPRIVTLVGHGGGHGGGQGGGGGKHYGGGGGKHYAYKGDHHKRYGYYGGHRRYGSYGWYGLPYISYGNYGGGCGWLYRNALATGSPYWWNRYYECTGYY